MDFFCFLLLNMVLFIRPAEFIPSLADLPLYELMLGVCLVTGFPRLLGQATSRAVLGQPITALVVALLPIMVLSNLVRGQGDLAWDTASTFFKIVLYYMLLVAVVDSTRRLVVFLVASVLIAVVIMGISVLDFHGYIHVPGLARMTDIVQETDSDYTQIRRMGSTGLFADPNDVSLLIVQNLLIAGYFVADRSSPLALRLLWIGPLALLGHALTLTQSRGGFLNLICGLLTFLAVRFGRKAGPVAVICLPLLLVVFGGRQTALSVTGGTGQQRTQIWADYLQLARRNPVFGIGCSNSLNYIDHVAHNSFIHCFVELGFVGGAAFLGAFGLAFWSVKRLAPGRVKILDPPLERLRPLMLAMVVSYVVGMMTLSRAYVIPTYNVLGLVVAYTHLAATRPSLPALSFNARLLVWLGLAGVAFLIVITFYCTFAVRYQ